MPDQAEKLRHLIQSPTPAAAPAAPAGAPLVVVTGARAGVGATTVAVNLGAVLADRAKRVLVVDAADEGPNMREIAGVRTTTEYSLADVLGGKCEIADAITPGPAGTMLLAARGRVRRGGRECESRRDSPTCSRSNLPSRAQQDLVARLHSLHNDFDIIIIDTGNGPSPSTRRLWLRAQLALLVTTPDDAIVMDAYAAIKLHTTGARDATTTSIRLLVNMSENDRAAENAHRRLTNCCQRFLRQSVAALPPLPRYEECEDASEGLWLRVWESPNSEFGHAALWLGRAVSDALEARNSASCATACNQPKRSATSRSTARC
ncbi:MAG: AAA family ATPase [Planctomycetes bacterium]|nr:AAA family ATPase [Planctomycetota bacterium]